VGFGGGGGLAVEVVPKLQRATEDISLNYSQVLSFNFPSVLKFLFSFLFPLLVEI